MIWTSFLALGILFIGGHTHLPILKPQRNDAVFRSYSHKSIYLGSKGL